MHMHSIGQTIKKGTTHPARTGRAVFSQLSAAVVRHKANDGVVYAIRAWFKTTIQHCLQWYKLVLRTRLSTPANAVSYTDLYGSAVRCQRGEADDVREVDCRRILVTSVTDIT